ncbi:MAG: hypothetical protein J0M18_20435, partial [Ignavibacteria bacterium]|nr:hypothetical protein [Ignavibacteria bacterium]
PIQNLIAGYSKDLLISNDIWDLYLSEIAILKESGDITQDDIDLLMASNELEPTLLNLQNLAYTNEQKSKRIVDFSLQKIEKTKKEIFDKDHTILLQERILKEVKDTSKMKDSILEDSEYKIKNLALEKKNVEKDFTRIEIEKRETEQNYENYKNKIKAKIILSSNNKVFWWEIIVSLIFLMFIIFIPWFMFQYLSEEFKNKLVQYASFASIGISTIILIVLGWICHTVYNKKFKQKIVNKFIAREFKKFDLDNN